MEGAGKFQAQRDSLDSKLLVIALRENLMNPQIVSGVLRVVGEARRAVQLLSDEDIIGVAEDRRHDLEQKLSQDNPGTEVDQRIHEQIISLIIIFIMEIKKTLTEETIVTEPKPPREKRRRGRPPGSKSKVKPNGSAKPEYTAVLDQLLPRLSINLGSKLKELTDEQKTKLRFGIFAEILRNRGNPEPEKADIEALMDNPLERSVAASAIQTALPQNSLSSAKSFLAYVVGGELRPGQTRSLRSADWWEKFAEG